MTCADFVMREPITLVDMGCDCCKTCVVLNYCPSSSVAHDMRASSDRTPYHMIRILVCERLVHENI